MTNLNTQEFMKWGDDDIHKAIDGLDMFTKNYCLNVKEVEKQNDLVFRCSECPFSTEDHSCLIKNFAFTVDKEYAIDIGFGVMGRTNY
jgi:ribosomal protein L44E